MSRGIGLKNAVRALNIREINFSDIDIIHVQFFSLAPITYLLNKRLIKLVSIRGKDISSKESTKQKEIEFIAKNFNAFLPVSKSLSKKQNINVQPELSGDGPGRHKLNQLSQKLNIESNISFLNILPNSKVINKLKHTDFLLVPSLTAKGGDSEGIPNVAKEAMALGCIVIISNHSGNTELVGNKQGFVFEENNLNDYIRATLNAINSDTNKLNNIRINARQKVEKHFAVAYLWVCNIVIYLCSADCSICTLMSPEPLSSRMLLRLPGHPII